MGRKSDAKQRLIGSAQALIYTRGMNAVSVADICAHAGVRKGSFYHFFPSKEALVLETIEHFDAQNQGFLDEVFEQDLPVRAQLERLFERYHAQHRANKATDGCIHGCPLGNLALELGDEDEALRARLGRSFGTFESKIAALLDVGVSRGELSVENTAEAAQALVAYIEGAIMVARTHNDPETIPRLASRALRLIEDRPS